MSSHASTAEPREHGASWLVSLLAIPLLLIAWLLLTCSYDVAPGVRIDFGWLQIPLAAMLGHYFGRGGVRLALVVAALSCFDFDIDPWHRATLPGLSVLCVWMASWSSSHGDRRKAYLEDTFSWPRIILLVTVPSMFVGYLALGDWREMAPYLLPGVLRVLWPELLFLLALYVAAYAFFFWMARWSSSRGDQRRPFLGDAFYADRKNWPRITLLLIVSSIFVGYRVFGQWVAWDGSDLLLAAVFALGAWGPGPRRLPGLLLLLALYIAAYVILRDLHVFLGKSAIVFPVLHRPEKAVSIVLMYGIGLSLRRDLAVAGSTARLVFSILGIAAVVGACLQVSEAFELNADKDRWIIRLWPAAGMIAALVYGWRWGMPGFVVVGAIVLGYAVLLPLGMGAITFESSGWPGWTLVSSLGRVEAGLTAMLSMAALALFGALYLRSRTPLDGLQHSE